VNQCTESKQSGDTGPLPGLAVGRRLGHGHRRHGPHVVPPLRTRITPSYTSDCMCMAMCTSVSSATKIRYHAHNMITSPR
jgi:hypothetical protein